MNDQIQCRSITNRAEWLNWRRFDVTSTDVAVLCGVHPRRTRLKVWAEKSNLIMQDADNPTLQRGRWGQSAVFAMLRDLRPDWQIREASVYLRFPELRLAATPDGGAVNPEREGIGTIETKMVREDIFDRFWPNGEPPLYHQLQTLTAAMLMNASWAVIAALIMDMGGGWHPHIYFMERHAQVEAKIRRATAQFWADFDAGRMPLLDPDRDAETVAEMYPKPLKTSVDLSTDNELSTSLAERAILKAEVKAREKRIGQIETDVKAKLGVHESAILPGWKVSWAVEHRKEHFVAASDPRVLRVSKEK